MDTRKLLSITVLYGAADVLVMAMGGFLLLPLYTRTLTQAEFGTYVVVKANTEILTYLVALGLPSAVSRVYFDYRKMGQQGAYVSSILLFFALCLAVLVAVLAAWGERLWALLSPTTPSHPFLAFSVALAAGGFLSTIGTLWLRMEGRATAFALVQVGTAVLLAGLAVLNLVTFQMGLPGLLWALLLSTAAGSLLLPCLLGRDFSFAIRLSHISHSLTYAGPILLGYVAYFLLNRISTLLLQRHVAMDEIAVFGLAQQLAMVVTIAAGAFGKAQQPMVFAAEPANADVLLQKAGRLLRALMLALTGVLLLFAAELLAIVAPKSYAAGLPILLVMLVANYAYSFSQVSDTALLYHRRPRSSVAVSIAGAVLSVCLSLMLVPRYHALGAALAVAVTFTAMTLLSHWLAWRVTGRSNLLPIGMGLAVATGLAVVAAVLPSLGWPAWLSIGIKLVLALLTVAAAGWRHIRPTTIIA